MSGCSPPFAVATGLIIGASRGIGVETVKAALEAGHSVRALSRSVRRIPVAHPKLEKMAGDALEMATVKRALTGTKATEMLAPCVVIDPISLSAKPFCQGEPDEGAAGVSETSQ
jgi:NAD(P)-dependent dehydrogenase (short-subunit alcohol dehydrogenase family)